jgi:rhamnogalacturonyl hydrolase YesR
VSFYKAVAVFVRAFAAIAQDLTEAGYTDAEAAALQREVEFYAEIRSAIKKHSDEELDIKPFEADMRHLLNTYVQADPAADLGELGEMSLTELIIKTGIHDAIARKLNEKGKLSRNAIAEGIINNVRKTIIRNQLTDPRFYEQMSKLLDDLIRQSRADTTAYEEFLRQAEELVRRLVARQPDQGVPAVLYGKRQATVIYNNLPQILTAGVTQSEAAAGEPGTKDEEARPSGASDRPSDARERSRGLEGRPGPRGPGSECSVPTAQSRPRRHPRAVRTHQEPAWILMVDKIQFGEIAVAVTRKDIKNVHLSVHPPDGHVTLVAPKGTRLEVVRAYVASKLHWIRDQQAKLRGQSRETTRQYVERESHYLWGRRYLLSVREAATKPAIRLDHRRIVLTVRPGTDRAKREAIIHAWHGSLWAELYLHEHDQKMIQPAISWLNTRDPRSPAGRQTRWYLEGSRAYVDSLYGASALAMLARATGDSRYYDVMHRFFDDVTAELFDKEAGLYYRDNRFIGQLTPNGKKIFWARGNGWVFAGIARILEYLPQNDRHRPHYVEIYRRMASELVKRQSADGLWRVSLDDPEILPDPETSGTGFFCYGLAWGVNHAVLDRKQYHQPIVKAFRGLVRSVSPEGKVQWGQLVDDQPNAAKRESTHEYVTGTFLLAASEVYKLKH